MRLPNGHLISTDGYEQLLESARKERRTPTDPFTRKELPPSTSADEMRNFCSAPLGALGLERFVTLLGRSELGQERVSGALGFDVSQHPDTRSKVALDMQSRLSADADEFAQRHNGSSVARCVFLRSAEEAVNGPDDSARAAAEAQLKELLSELSALRDKDASCVRDALPLVLKRANAVPMEGVPRSEQRPREIFMLRQIAGQEASVSTDFMFCLLISSGGEADLRATNPHITDEAAQELFDLAVSVVLHSSRVGQINRCVSEASGLLKLLQPRSGSYGANPAARREAVSAITLKAQTLAENLLGRRHYIEPADASAGGLGLQYDPRFLLFEFTHNIVLRQAQVQLVREFVEAVRSGRPLVKQMLMGGGKTTVVGPCAARTRTPAAQTSTPPLPLWAEAAIHFESRVPPDAGCSRCCWAMERLS